MPSSYAGFFLLHPTSKQLGNVMQYNEFFKDTPNKDVGSNHNLYKRRQLNLSFAENSGLHRPIASQDYARLAFEKPA